MLVSAINSITSFKSEATAPISKKEQVIPQYYESDKVELSKPKEKRGFFNRLKEGFINIRKFFINAGYAAVGTAKGVVAGAIGGLAVLGGAAVKNMVNKAPQTLTKGNKVLAGVVGASLLGVELIKAKLKANDRGADLDHKWHTGHDRN